MHITKEQKLAWHIQILCTALLVAIILGVLLLRRGGRSGTLYWILLGLCLFFIPRHWFQNIKTVFTSWWEMDSCETRRLLGTSLASTLAFTIALHGFLFTNEFFSHDSLTMCLRTFDYYLSLGRPLLSLYEFLRGGTQPPLLIGVLFALWMTLASVLAIRLLNLQKTVSRVLVCGLLCGNTALIHVGATYIFCIDEYALALFAALAAAWFFSSCHNAELIGILCVIVSLMCYQAYFAAAAAFCLFVLIRPLTENKPLFSTILQGIRSFVLLVAGFCLYYLIWSASCTLFNVEALRTDTTILGFTPMQVLNRVISAYKDWFFLQAEAKDVLGRLYPAITFLVAALILFWLTGWLFNRQLFWGNKFLLALLISLLPAVFNASYILFIMGNQLLVSINRGLVGVLLLLCMDCQSPQNPVRRCKVAAALLALSLIWQSAVFANKAYLKKELEKASTLSVVTRVLGRIEQLDGYIPGETPVYFIGSLVNNSFLADGRPGFESFTTVYSGGLMYDYAATYNMGRYLQNYLNYPIVIASGVSNGEEIPDMPAFPTNGSIQFVGNTVVVRLS